MAGGSHRYEIKFVTDIEDILRKVQELCSKIGQMRAELIIDAKILGPDGRPVSSGFAGGGQAQGLNVSSSPGTSMRGMPGAIDLRDPSTAHVVASGVRSDPYDGRSSYQSFRQDDPALAMLMAQRSVREREQHIALLTGGRTAGEFLSDRIRGLSGADDSESKATLAALQKFKNELDETSKIMAKLKAERTDALASGDMTRASAAQREMEERTRIKESIVQNSMGSDRAGGINPGIIAGAVVTGILAALPKFTQFVANSPLVNAGWGAQVGDLNSRLAKTSFQTGEGLTMFDSDILQKAALSGDFADIMTPLNPMTYVHGAGGLLGAMAGFQVSSPADAAAAKNASAFLDKALKQRGVQVESIDQAFGRGAGRRSLGQQLGLSQGVMAGLSGGTFMPNTLGYGFGEADQLTALQSAFGMNMGAGGGGDVIGGLASQKAQGFGRLTSALPSMMFRARATGIDLQDVVRQTGGLMTAGGTEELANKQQEEIVFRGVQRGVIGAGLVKQTDALVSLAQQSAGVGAVGTGAFNRIFDAASQVAGSNLGTDAGKTVSEMMRSERTSRSGLPGLVNRLTADKVVRSMFPHLSPAVRDQAIRTLSFHDPSEWGSPVVWTEVQKAISDGLPSSQGQVLSNTEFDLLRGSPDVQDQLVSNLQTQGEQYQQQLFKVFGGGNATMGRLMMPGPATSSVLRQEIGDIIAAGGGNMSPQQVGNQLQQQYGVNIKDPTVQAAIADDVKNSLLANRGIEALDRIITRLQDSGGSMQMIATAIGQIADKGPAAANALKSISAGVNPPGPKPAVTPR